MKTHEFLATVRDRGNYADQGEAERVTHVVLNVLARRLGADEAEDAAAQLPVDLQDAMYTDTPAESFGVEQFLSRVSAALGTSPETAQWDTSAVLTTVGEAVTGGELNQILTRLQPGFAMLFGKADLA